MFKYCWLFVIVLTITITKIVATTDIDKEASGDGSIDGNFSGDVDDVFSGDGSGFGQDVTNWNPFIGKFKIFFKITF
jgi:hypothetical protein